MDGLDERPLSCGEPTHPPIAGRYRLRTPIGRGGAGVVWAAHDELLQRAVAVKEVVDAQAQPAAEGGQLRARVLREARALARLQHPGLVTVFDVLHEDGRSWIVMELVDAPSLAEVVRLDGPLPPERVAGIGAALLDALDVAHRAGVLHQDVKPGNVLVGRDGRVRLTDFGIASTPDDPALGGAGVVLGSPSYIAPERARGLHAGPSSDLWSLGATLYTAVEGTAPYEGADPVAVLGAVVAGRRRPCRRAGPLAPVLHDLLDQPEERRPDAVELRARLVDVAAGGAPATALRRPRGRWRHRAAVLGTSAAALATVAVPLTGIIDPGRSSAPGRADGAASPPAASGAPGGARSPGAVPHGPTGTAQPGRIRPVGGATRAWTAPGHPSAPVPRRSTRPPAPVPAASPVPVPPVPVAVGHPAPTVVTPPRQVPPPTRPTSPAAGRPDDRGGKGEDEGGHGKWEWGSRRGGGKGDHGGGGKGDHGGGGKGGGRGTPA